MEEAEDVAAKDGIPVSVRQVQPFLRAMQLEQTWLIFQKIGGNLLNINSL